MYSNIEKMLQEHSNLFEYPISKIGELHYKILKSKKIVDEQRKKDIDFDKEIGLDEIRWWVFYKETNLKELKNNTNRVLEISQKIKDKSVELKQSSRSKKYPELISKIKKFCVDHESEIQFLLDYVDWLNAKDPRAVTMLFNYRVWGSTRMGERTVSLSKIDEKIAINTCIEIVLGLIGGYSVPTVSKTCNNIIDDILSSKPLEDSFIPIEIPWDTVVLRTSYEVLAAMSEYFKFIRDSLKNILLDIEEYEKSDNILHNSKFWKAFVKNVMMLPIENMTWDFKQTLAMWEMKGKRKKEKEVEFCEDVASFANMQGGVLIIGISNQMPRKVVGLDNLEHKMKYAKDILQQGINYDRHPTHFQVLSLEDEQGVEQLCLLIIIQQTMDVVEVNNKKIANGRSTTSTRITPTCPIRNETGITRVSNQDVSNSKAHLKHDSYSFITSLETNYSAKK